MYKFVFAIVCLLLMSAFSVPAQDDPYLKTYRERTEKNPKDVDFTIKFKNDQTKFRLGEIISLELRIRTSTPNRYNYLNRTYDRSGRLHLDGFIVDKKEKTFDPLDDYFSRSAGYSTGGLYSRPTLGSGAEFMEYELNEFLSFKEPGRYRIYIASPRVSIKKEVKDNVQSAFGGGSVSLVSNIIDFEILPPDEKWQKEKLAEAVSRDCKILRYLGTKDAAKEMLIRYAQDNGSCNSDNYFGLYGSPERGFIIEEMEKMLVSPDFAVTYEFFRTLLQLEHFLKNPAPEKSETGFWSVRNKKEEEKQNPIKRAYLEKLGKALPAKNEKAFQKSFETYFSFHAEGEKQPSPELLDILAKTFDKLPKQTQYLILQTSLNKIKTPAILPVLQSIYNNSEKVDLANLESYYDNYLFSQSIKGIYDLDREAGKQIILSEMRRPKQKAFATVLQLLPKTESPETEDILLEKLSGGNIPADDLESVFMLVDHYETPKLLSKLRETYADKIDKIECGAKIEFLRIFLKSDIEFAAEMIDKAIKGDSKKDCHEAILANGIAPHWSPAIERIVLDLLEDDNIYIIENASDLLGKYGSLEAKDKLWKRLERFSKEESGKKDFAEIKEDKSNWRIFSTESSLVSALSRSPNWFFDREELQRLSKLCTYKYCKEEVEELNKIFNAPVNIKAVIDDEDELTFSVGQYKELSSDALKKKLEQFPRDTTFNWISNPKNSNDAKYFQEIKDFAESRRMKLKKGE